MTVQFLGWQEPDSRKDLTRRIAESCERFAARYGRPATILRVNPRTILPATVELPVEQSRLVPVGQVWPGADFNERRDHAAPAQGGGTLLPSEGTR